MKLHIRFVAERHELINYLHWYTKKWSVYQVTLSYPHVFWLAKQKSVVRKASFPSSFKKIAKKPSIPWKSWRTSVSFRKIGVLLLLCMLVTTSTNLYLPRMISVFMKLYNPQVLSKSSVKALKTTKNEFRVMPVICPEICRLKLLQPLYSDSLDKIQCRRTSIAKCFWKNRL